MSSLATSLLGTAHYDNAQFEAAIKRCIPSDFLLIASQDDRTQAQEDYFAMDHYGLGKHVPKYVRKANAGACATSALLSIMYENPKRLVAGGDDPLNVLELSRELKKRIKQCSKLEARPTISSSRPLGPPRMDKSEYAPFYVVPPGYKGTRRALLIGVVTGEGADLKGPPNDVTNIQQVLQRHCGFQLRDITVLQDFYDGAGARKPTKKNILAGFQKMVRESRPGDVCFIQFSGHGGRMGNQLYICPSDCQKAGQVSDEMILKDLIKAMPANVYATMVVDCCYSGTVGDLPYVLQSGSPKQSIDAYYDTDMRKEMLRKEAQDPASYQQYKQARAEKRLMGRIADVISVVANTATVAGKTAANAAVYTGKTAANAAVYTGKTTATAVSVTGQTAANAAVYTGKTAATAVSLTGKTAANAAMYTGKTASTAVSVTGKTAASAVSETGKVAAAAVTITGQTAANAAKYTGKTAAAGAKTVGNVGTSTATFVGKTGISAVSTVADGIRHSAGAANLVASAAASLAAPRFRNSTRGIGVRRVISAELVFAHGGEVSPKKCTSSKSPSRLEVGQARETLAARGRRRSLHRKEEAFQTACTQSRTELMECEGRRSSNESTGSGYSKGSARTSATSLSSFMSSSTTSCDDSRSVSSPGSKKKKKNREVKSLDLSFPMMNIHKPGNYGEPKQRSSFGSAAKRKPPGGAGRQAAKDKDKVRKEAVERPKREVTEARQQASGILAMNNDNNSHDNNDESSELSISGRGSWTNRAKPVSDSLSVFSNAAKKGAKKGAKTTGSAYHRSNTSSPTRSKKGRTPFRRAETIETAAPVQVEAPSGPAQRRGSVLNIALTMEAEEAARNEAIERSTQASKEAREEEKRRSRRERRAPRPPAQRRSTALINSNTFSRRVLARRGCREGHFTKGWYRL